MIALVLAMVWSRRGQALMLALLSLFAVAAAVAAPAYLRAADRAVAAGQVATAASAERSLVLTSQSNGHRIADPDPPGQDNLTSTGATLVDLPKFQYVYASEFPAVGIEQDNRAATALVYRQGVCAHLVMVSGRCLISEGDVVLGEQTARRLNLVVGQPITLSFAVFNKDPDFQIFQPGGVPKRFILAGTYRVPDPNDIYWGTHGYFAAASPDRPAEPAFVTAPSFAVMDRGGTQLSIDGVAGPGALDVDRIAALRAGVAALQENLTRTGGVTLNTQIPALLDRIDTGRKAAHLIVPVMAVPLILLACLSIFLAVGYGTEGRRPELAVVALRGARWPQRWWLGTGENLVSIVLGAVAGCLTGQLLVNAVAAWRFPGVGADPGLSSLRYAPIAALAAVLAALLAERRQLLTPVTELLRRAPTVPGSAGAIATEIVIALLAAVAGVQLVSSDGSLAGVGTFAPALIILALALLTARALLPVVTRYAGRALRTGRIGVALAGFQLSRRPGAVRLFALLIAAVSVAGYAACAVDVAARQRDVQAQLGTGADRVIAVQGVGRQQLLTAVRAVDPQGRFAMAAVRLPTGPGDPVGLAVDSTRLAAVGFGDDLARTARLLRPSAPAPLILPGQDVSFEVSADGFREGHTLTLGVVLTSVRGLGDAVIQLGIMRQGRHTYSQRVPVCAGGCRLQTLRLASGYNGLDVSGRLILHGLDPATRWRASEGGALTAAPDGLHVDIRALAGLPEGVLVQPVDTPYPLPVVAAGTVRGTSIAGLDGRAVPATRVGRLAALPEIGRPAILVDLDYADLVSTDGSASSKPEIWLSAAAPADVVDRLTARGLVVVGDTRIERVRDQLGRQGPALALWFSVLAGLLSVALAAGALILAAAVDRARRVEDLSAMRDQGLSRRALRQATLWTYPVLVAIAVLAGLLIALAGWGLTGWALPLAGLNPPNLPLPGWPRPWVLAGTGAAALVVLVWVAYSSGRRTYKAIG
jgi:putative ABC transport system permease protein